MQVRIVETKSIDDVTYLDVMEIDGQFYTFVMKKSGEPNLFDVHLREDGNTIDTIISRVNE